MDVNVVIGAITNKNRGVGVPLIHVETPTTATLSSHRNAHVPLEPACNGSTKCNQILPDDHEPSQ